MLTQTESLTVFKVMFCLLLTVVGARVALLSDFVQGTDTMLAKGGYTIINRFMIASRCVLTKLLDCRQDN